ncbi:MAG: DNA polymerase III subunit gamma/tau [Candidatus Spechtbacterales bacterium]
MSQVLYRKYRPRSFSEVAGQEHIITTLQNTIKMGNVAHAYLFTGPRGTGKTTTARLFSKLLNCENPVKFDACLKCLPCKEIESGSFADLIEIDAASNRGIENIRDLKDAVRFSPNIGKYKIYIIDEVHMLSKDAFNALLKTLEEPPAHAIFILATTELHKVLPTVVSRTQKFDFRYLTHKEILDRIKVLAKKEGKSLEDESARIIMAASGGSLRDAESILGQVLSLSSVAPDDVRSVLGIPSLSAISIFIDHIVQKNTNDVLGHINTLAEQGADFTQFAQSAVEYARILLLMKLSPSSQNMLTAHLSDEEIKTASHQVNELTEKQLYAIIGALLEAGNDVKNSPVPQLPLELAAAKLAGDS